MTPITPPPSPVATPSWWRGAVVWVLAGLAMALLDGHIDLANLALVLVLAAALAALWLAPPASMPVCAAAVLAFNIAFVPPRGRLTVDVRQHALLLFTMLAVSWIVSWLVARQRQLAAAERLQAQRAGQLQALGDTLRECDDAQAGAGHLQAQLAALTGTSAALLIAPDSPGPAAAFAPIGEASADEAAGLRLCHDLGRAMGPGTGWHEEEPAWYLPLRGRRHGGGAALLRVPAAQAGDAALRLHAQALCDQLGQALERSSASAAADAARSEARAHGLRNTLLAAISHDYRTPLATIMGAASSLQAQDERLSPAQRQQLAATIVDETEQLSRMTTNTLQLARLDAPGLQLQLDWESAEEIVGTVIRRVRRRDPLHRVRLRLEPGLPLLRCDAVLLVQLLENLLDNALRHGGDAAVELWVRRAGAQIVLAVRDRGPGIAPAWRERVFEVFQRGEPAGTASRRGAGVGLALCRAIARAHGGELRLRPRGHGGSSFECHLPIAEQPALIS